MTSTAAIGMTYIPPISVSRPRRPSKNRAMAHAQFRAKLQAVGSGHSFPFSFVWTAMSLDARSFITHIGTLTRVPVFFVALLIVRGLPALLYRRLLTSGRQVVTAELLQATSLSIRSAAARSALIWASSVRTTTSLWSPRA